MRATLSVDSHRLTTSVGRRRPLSLDRPRNRLRRTVFAATARIARGNFALRNNSFEVGNRKTSFWWRNIYFVHEYEWDAVHTAVDSFSSLESWNVRFRLISITVVSSMTRSICSSLIRFRLASMYWQNETISLARREPLSSVPADGWLATLQSASESTSSVLGARAGDMLSSLIAAAALELSSSKRFAANGRADGVFTGARVALPEAGTVSSKVKRERGDDNLPGNLELLEEADLIVELPLRREPGHRLLLYRLAAEALAQRPVAADRSEGCPIRRISVFGRNATQREVDLRVVARSAAISFHFASFAELERNSFRPLSHRHGFSFSHFTSFSSSMDILFSCSAALGPFAQRINCSLNCARTQTELKWPPKIAI